MTDLVGAPLALAVICLTVGALLWHHEHHFQRFTAWMFALAAAFGTIAFPQWDGALAGLLQTGSGQVALLILVLVAGVPFYLGAVRTHKPSSLRSLVLTRRSRGDKGHGKPAGPGTDLVPYVSGTSPRRPNRHQRIGTPVAAMMTGTLSVAVFGGWRILAASAARSVTQTGKDLLNSQSQINSGHAAAAVPQSVRPQLYVFAVIALVVIVVLMRRHDRRKSKRAAGSQGGPAFGRG